MRPTACFCEAEFATTHRASRIHGTAASATLAFVAYALKEFSALLGPAEIISSAPYPRPIRQTNGDDPRAAPLVRIVLFATILLATITGVARPEPALGSGPENRCTHYASPSGQDNGTSPERPFRIAAFWRLARPGDVLCLQDGIYRGADSMITPPQETKGQVQHPITVRALNDGRVLIDGEISRRPVALYRNDWIVISGLNACCSSGTVVEITQSSHNVIRRVAAWDSAEGNNFIFGIHSSNHNLLEDVAGWGIARKIYSSSQGGDFTTIRRAWGRWEGSHAVGPKWVYSLAYNNYGMLVENAIGTWSGEQMTKSYVLLDYYGKPWDGPGAGLYRDAEVDQPYGIFGTDGLKDDKSARARLLGSIAYIMRRDVFTAKHLVFVTRVDSMEIADTLAYIEPGAYPLVRTFGLYSLAPFPNRAPARSLIARDITGFGGAGALITTDWASRNKVESPSPSGGPFNVGRGANLCHRYVDGVLGNRPLWPWPMNQRILDAMIESGRQPLDVTATIEKLFGRIPAECRQAP